MPFGLAVALEQAADERQQRHPLELTPPFGAASLLGCLKRGFEAVGGVAGLRGERRHDLTEADVALRERLGVALRTEEDRPNDGASPPHRHHNDRSNVAEVEEGAYPGEHRVVQGVGDEHRLARLEGAPQLGIAAEVDDEVADRRVLVARDEPDVARIAGEEYRAPIEPERLAELPGDGLQNVYEMERRRDFLEDIDDRDELVTLPLELRDSRLQRRDLASRTASRVLVVGRFALIHRRAECAR